MKTKLASLAVALGCSLMGTAAQAALTVDNFLFSQAVSPNNPASEQAALQAWLDTNMPGTVAVFDYKVESANFGTLLSDGTLRGYDVPSPAPSFFVLKFGAQGNGVDSYFFQNLADLTQLVWDSAIVPDPNIQGGGLSHYTLFEPAGGTVNPAEQVPEPGTLALAGLGLLGALASRRRRKA